MITYDPFWRTLRNSKETTYTLITKHHISNSTIHRLRKNSPISTVTINDLCRILQCEIQDIAIYTDSDEDMKL